MEVYEENAFCAAGNCFYIALPRVATVLKRHGIYTVHHK